jgi:hypothetical protein
MDVQIFSFPDNNTLKVRRRKLEEEEEINDVSAERCGDFQSNFYSVRWLGGRVKQSIEKVISSTLMICMEMGAKSVETNKSTRYLT